jgi:aspartokinase
MEQHTKFEKARGLSSVTIRDGFVQVHISGWESNRAEQRLEVLRACRVAAVSIDFLKLTRSGMSFLTKDENAEAIQKVLEASGHKFSLRKPCSVVLAHAVNIRDEEGLVANIMKTAIEGGFHVHHISDMHDRAIMVVDTDQAQALAKELASEGGRVAHAS